MKASELINKLQTEIAANGDNEIVIAANKHSYKDVMVLTREDKMYLSLFDKIDD